MKGGKNRQLLGYTIIEVMIVLAVSGLIFLMAISFISGKQEHSSFVAGVDQMASEIQDTIQQVGSGEYSDIPINCTPGNGVVPDISPTFSGTPSPTQGQGTNSGCVFVGKFIHFWTASGPSSYEVFTLAGNRLIGGTTNPAASISDVAPVPVYPTDPYNAEYDLTTQDTIPENLKIDTTGSIQGITVDDSSGGVHPGVFGFGFMESLGSIATGGDDSGTYLSGGQTIDLIYAPTLTTPSLTEPLAEDDLTPPSGTAMAYASSVTICLTDGTQYATINIGGNSSPTTAENLNVTSQIIEGPSGYGDATCH